ncbi:MAG TPA: DUF4157 domain-containing protein, partial [Xanthobacteraceae bacterium]|nr:DUF4157 domain-containing protein [Xanthobacteraceae bacterium]
MTRASAAVTTTATARANPAAAPVPGLLQRKCACGGSQAGFDGECEDCRKEKLQRKGTGWNLAGRHAPPIVHDVLRQPGDPLDRRSRALMEPRFGRSFGDVRIHTDARAAASARATSALAYTVGHHIVFDSGRFDPRSMNGQRLLAHELTHVVQQSGAAPSLQRETIIGSPGEEAEAEAEAAADRVVAGGRAHVSASAASALLLRQEKQDGGDAAEKPLSRADEIELSRSSAGKIAAAVTPPVISLYNFAINGAELKSEHVKALAEVADIIKHTDDAKVGVLVVGHADASGTPAVNRPLSKQRAVAVQQALASGSGRTIGAEWAGDTNPAGTNDTVDGRSRNRRVDIHFLAVGSATAKKTKKDEPPPPPPPPTKDEPKGDQPDKPVQPPPKQDQPKTDEPKKDEPKKDKPKKDDGDDDAGFCTNHPIICGAIGGAAGLAGLAAAAAGAAEALGGAAVTGGAALLHCIKNPESCLPTGGPEPDDGGKDKDKDKD